MDSTAKEAVPMPVSSIEVTAGDTMERLRAVMNRMNEVGFGLVAYADRVYGVQPDDPTSDALADNPEDMAQQLMKVASQLENAATRLEHAASRVLQ